MTQTTTKWTLKTANEYLQNIIAAENIEHDFKILSAKNRTKDYYYLVDKKTGYNIMSWSWDTLKQLMTAIEKDRNRFIEAMKRRADELNAA